MARLLQVCASVCLLIAATGVRASVVYDNGPPDRTHGTEMTGWIEADDFTLSAPARLDGFKLWQVDINGGFTRSLLWRIYSDKGAGRGPGEVLYSGTSTNLVHEATGFTVAGGYPEYVTTVTLPPLSLPRGTYWLALHNGPLTKDKPWDCFWETTGNRSGSPSHALSSPFTGTWTSNVYQTYPSDLAFELMGGSSAALDAFRLEPDAPKFSFRASEGQSYRVEYKDHLGQLSWTPLPGAEMVSGHNEVIDISDPAAFAERRPQRFYQVALPYTGPGVPQILAVDHSGRVPRIGFTTASGYLYRVEYRDELSGSGWKPVVGAELITGNGAVMHVNDPDVNKSAPRLRLYRVSLL